MAFQEFDAETIALTDADDDTLEVNVVDGGAEFSFMIDDTEVLLSDTDVKKMFAWLVENEYLDLD